MSSINMLNLVSAPSLPLATEEYSRQYIDQLNSVLRVYFNRLGSNLNSTIGSSGGRYLQFPYAAVQRTTNLTFTANTATEVTFNQNDYLNDCTNPGTDGITVNRTGLYNYQFSIQYANTDTAAHTVWIWLRVDSTDVPGTGSKWDVPSKHGASDGYLVAAANFYIQLNAGQSVKMYSAVDNAAAYMEAYAAQTVPFAMPSIPSVVATLSFVSAV